MRNRLVIIEGPNGVGKSTIRPIVARLLGQTGDHVIDRLVASYYVMDGVHGRLPAPSVDELLTQLRMLQTYCYDVFHVTLIGTPAEMLRRLTFQRGSHNETIESLEVQQSLFSEFDAFVKGRTPIPSTQFSSFDHDGPNAAARFIAEWVQGYDRRPA